MSTNRSGNNRHYSSQCNGINSPSSSHHSNSNSPIPIDTSTSPIGNRSTSPLQLLIPQKRRKRIPGFSESQKSFSPGSTNSPNRISQRNQTRDMLKNALNKPYVSDFGDINNIVFRIGKSFGDKGRFCILIGFVLGYLLCSGIVKYFGVNKCNEYEYMDNNGNCVNLCPCDINDETMTFFECKSCLDKYNYTSLNNNYINCQIRLTQFNNKYVNVIETLNKMKIKQNILNKNIIDENNKFKETAIINWEEETKKCEYDKNEYIKLNEELMKEYQDLVKEIEEISKINENEYGNGNSCDKYIFELKKVFAKTEHDLGECNIQLGTCQMEIRQKDNLDKLRVEEIQKWHRRFNQCNQQLKDYKTSKNN